MIDVRDLMLTGPVIPVIVIDDLSTAKPLAEALVAGGIRVLEVTLRTPAGIEAIRAMNEVDGAIVGVGTALTADDLSNAKSAGAQFAVSPGYTGEIGKRAHKLSIPLLPGVANSADIMRARADGYTAVKFFPAVQAGGVSMLKALGGPFVDTVFCPTGGISTANAKEFLALPNVLCVGGSWLCPKDLVAAGAWSDITELAKQASQLSN